MQFKTVAVVAALLASASAFAQTAPAPAPQQLPPQLHALTPAQQAFVQSPQFQQDRQALLTALQAKNDAGVTAAKNKLDADSRAFQANFARAPQAAAPASAQPVVRPAASGAAVIKAQPVAPAAPVAMQAANPQMHVTQLYPAPAGVLPVPASAPVAKK